MIKSSLTILCGVLLSTSLLAASPLKSARISLGGGTATFDHPVNIDLSKLVLSSSSDTWVPYSVSCDIETTAQTENTIVNFGSTGVAINNFFYFYINGKSVSRTVSLPANTTAAFKAADVVRVSGASFLKIYDLDQDYPVIVSNCHADPVVSN